MYWDRLELLVGQRSFLNIKNTTVLVIGAGGVGGYAIESLARSFVQKIIIVDPDIIDITNINRQLIATTKTIGKNKVDVWEERIHKINPECQIIKLKEFITKENIDILFQYHPDYIIDACDTIETKKEIIRKCIKHHVKLISSMGTGNKLDPTKLKIMDIRKTSYDPIAKIIRKMIKEEKIHQKIMVVCSDEKSRQKNIQKIPSNSFVPATAGLLCTSYIINDIINIGEENEKSK